eukprot:gb/GEZN01017084.1/.p1 GENE.gb/GEZN01017084.1/~~gb/GEZN01017084.1/.p1  ORF type:complete len:230 (+),score=101.42 gb/GEZN01017084.1/:37-690(+)
MAVDQRFHYFTALPPPLSSSSSSSSSSSPSSPPSSPSSSPLPPSSSSTADSEGKKWSVPLCLLFQDSYQRCIAHGLVKFHQLVSRSFTDSQGRRVFCIALPKKGLPQPHNFTVVEFLKSRAALLAKNGNGEVQQETAEEEVGDKTERQAARRAAHAARARRLAIKKTSGQKDTGESTTGQKKDKARRKKKEKKIDEEEQQPGLENPDGEDEEQPGLQ